MEIFVSNKFDFILPHILIQTPLKKSNGEQFEKLDDSTHFISFNDPPLAFGKNHSKTNTTVIRPTLLFKYLNERRTKKLSNEIPRWSKWFIKYFQLLLRRYLTFGVFTSALQNRTKLR